MKLLANPFTPSAGHMPPHLAGREMEINNFVKLLRQENIMTNLILTGVRGVGKTVLLEALRPIAQKHKWWWVGSDLSESASISEENMAIRILTDLSLFTSAMTIPSTEYSAGFTEQPDRQSNLTFAVLLKIFQETPGLIADKLKHVLEYVWSLLMRNVQISQGVIFAYDEAQNAGDHAAKDQFPLSLLLDVFQSIQRKGIRFMLVLTGLPTLGTKLVEARTYSERMFHTITLGQLSPDASRDAILVPLDKHQCHLRPTNDTIEGIINLSAGYPYFIQFLCKELLDIWIQREATGNENTGVPFIELLRKLDSDFFASRWGRVTDRQKDLLMVIATLPNHEEEFTVHEIVKKSKDILVKPFTSSHVNQMLSSLIETGIIYKNRFGKYSFAVPLMGRFIVRQGEQEQQFNT